MEEGRRYDHRKREKRDKARIVKKGRGYEREDEN